MEMPCYLGKSPKRFQGVGPKRNIQRGPSRPSPGTPGGRGCEDAAPICISATLGPSLAPSSWNRAGVSGRRNEMKKNETKAKLPKGTMKPWHPMRAAPICISATTLHRLEPAMGGAMYRMNSTAVRLSRRRAGARLILWRKGCRPAPICICICICICDASSGLISQRVSIFGTGQCTE